MSLGSRRSIFGFLGVLFGLQACGQGNRGESEVQAFVQALGLGDVKSVIVSVSGVGINSPLSVPLYRQPEGLWSGVIGSIPAGEERTFSARAFDGDTPPRQMYSGAVAHVTVPRTGSVRVTIIMQEDGPSPEFRNHAPTIDQLTTSTRKLDPGDRVALTLVAHDEDTGETAALTLVPRTSCGGHFDTTQGEDVNSRKLWNLRWTAPPMQGICLLTFEVRDPHGILVVGTVSIEVGTGAGSGGARVETVFLSYPIINSITSTPVAPATALHPGGQTLLLVSATQPDNQALTYQWSSDCLGNFDMALSASPIFTLDPNSTAASCLFTVLVSGPAKASSNGVENRLVVAGSLVVTVGETAPVTELGGPVIDMTAQSANVVAPGDDVTLSVSAHETNPAAFLVSYTWYASGGTLGPASETPDLRSSQIVWTAPNRMEKIETITVVVTDSQGATASFTYFIYRADPPEVIDIRSSPLGSELNLVPGGQTLLSVTATEPSGGALSYAWDSDCPGGFDNASLASPVFTLSAAAVVSTCTFSVVVTGPVRTARDGHSYRLATTGLLTVSVGVVEPEPPLGGPEITGVSMSSDMVAPGGSVFLFVAGRETNPQASLVHYAWQASAGSLSPAVTASDLSSSQVLWTAPMLMGPWETVDVILTDSQGATAGYTFWIFNSSQN